MKTMTKTLLSLAVAAAMPLALAQMPAMSKPPVGKTMADTAAFKDGKDGGGKKDQLAFKDGKDGGKKSQLAFKEGVDGGKKGQMAFKDVDGKKGQLAFKDGKDGGKKLGAAGEMDALKASKAMKP